MISIVFIIFSNSSLLTRPRMLALATAIDMIARNGVIEIAIALLETSLPELTEFTFSLAMITNITRSASTLSRLWITRAIVETIARLLAVFAPRLIITRPIASMSLPTDRTEALSCLRIARRFIFASAFLWAILTVRALRAHFIAPSTTISRRTCARAIHRWTLRAIFTIALQITILSIGQEWTWPITQYAAPASLAIAFTRPRMAHSRIFFRAFACFVARFAVNIVRTPSAGAIDTLPSLRTWTGSVRGITRSAILTTTSLCTIHAEQVAGTTIQTLVAHEAWRTFAFTRDMMTISAIEAFAWLLTIRSVHSLLALIGAHVSGPAGRTLTLSALRIAFTAILAFAFLLALTAVLAIGTRFIAQRASETGRARTFAWNVMTCTVVLATAHLQTIETVTIDRAFQFAAAACVAFQTLACAIELIAQCTVFTIAESWTISTPVTGRTVCNVS